MKKEPLHDTAIKHIREYALHQEVLTDVFVHVFDAGEVVVNQGQEIQYIYLILSGKVKISTISSAGKELVLGFFMEQGVIGEVELFTGQSCATTTVSATSRLVCIAFPLHSWQKRMKENSTFLCIIGKQLANTLIRSGINGSVSILNSVEERISAYILQTSSNRVFSEKLVDVALFTGCSYRQLLRCMHRLCAEGVLKKEKSKYIIVDMKALEKRAGELYLL